MADPQDIVDVEGVRPPDPPASSGAGAGPRTPFLSVWFRCCHTYGRLYRNTEQTMYHGRCPRCGAWVRALIGPDGTSRRVFETT